MKQHTYKITAMMAALLLMCSGCGKPTTAEDSGSSGAETTVSADAQTTDSADGTSGSADETTAAGDAAETKAADPAQTDAEGTSVSDAETPADANSQQGNGNAETPQQGGQTAPSGEAGTQQNVQNTTPPQNNGSGGQQQEPAAQTGGDTGYEVGSEPTIGVGKITAHPGEKNVAVSVQFWNNPGFLTSGIQLFHDPAIRPVMDNDKLRYTLGEAADGLTAICSYGAEQRIVGFASFGTADSTKDGALYTCYFDIPDDAEPGTVYTFTTAIVSMNDIGSNPVTPVTMGGEIRIE